MDLYKKVLGEQAIELIEGYPLYASTSGITYDQAIAIAEIIEPDFGKPKTENKFNPIVIL